MMKQLNSLGLVLLTMVMGCGDNDLGTVDGTDTGITDSATGSDSGSLPTPYDNIDCDGAGQNSANCEGEICMQQESYLQLLAGCNPVDTGDNCGARLLCYETLATCLTIACPPGSAVPATKDERRDAGIYECETAFAECNTLLMTR